MTLNEQAPKSEDLLDELKAFILLSNIYIKNEFESTRNSSIPNSWMNCFETMLNSIHMYLGFQGIKEHLTEEQFIAAKENLEALRKETESLIKQYPTNETTPPKEIQDELIAKLDVFRQTK